MAAPWYRFTKPRFAALLAAAAAGGYATLVRPRMLRWGVTDEEASGTMPGDEIVAEPKYIANHAVTINAPAAAVWPWLAQMGQGRGGLYSYDWLENMLGLRIHSSDQVLPELQRLEPGDKVRLTPEDYIADLHYLVHEVDLGRSLVLVTPGSPAENFKKGLPFGTWAFVLRRIDNGTTRLVARSRNDFASGLPGLVWNKYGLEPVHFIMERRMLLGIKKRAESSVTTGGGAAASERGFEGAEAAA